ncbi:hypothetical protein GTY65_05835 [Streptomyces sp. SID8379]|uniref:hypothetical protein n=1 Tax=unclassified Streptomyces TaxID=2593676 RepID=UPI00035D5C56|nr:MULTISPECIES: hypothetical protein [unclassified Streptomyces]MYW63598.1 hypothetical protein [Streptomyces sp. SID8379]
MTFELGADSAVSRPARHARHWVAPVISSLVTLPAAFFAYVFASLMPMACDSCTEAEAARFDPSFDRAYTVFGWGLAVSLLLLVTAWLLPWQERFVARRIGFAVAAPFAVGLTYLVFMGMIDWP